jgi:hypothetical protein
MDELTHPHIIKPQQAAGELTPLRLEIEREKNENKEIRYLIKFCGVVI